MEGNGNGAAARDNARRLDLLKTLGDNTRYAIYLELARSPVPLTTADISATLDLHPNTVRPHLERMREVGLLLVSSQARGSVGRPQHRYSLAPDAPALGLEPSPWPTMAKALLEAAAAGGLGGEEVAEAGASQGRQAARRNKGASSLESLTAEQARLGFDPQVVHDETGTTMAFAHCPFSELAEENPELVCSLHCGLVDGHLSESGGTIARFHSLVDRTPCRVDLVGV